MRGFSDAEFVLPKALAWKGQALKRDLQDRVVAAVDNGVSCRRAAERFGVCEAGGVLCP